MKTSHTASNRLIEKTRKVWQPRMQRNLSDEDARQMAENVTGFFAILAEWSRPVRAVSVNDPTVVAPTEAAEVCHGR